LSTEEATAVRIRNLSPLDADRVIEIDARHTGERKPRYWQRVLAKFLPPEEPAERVGLAAIDDGRLVGYLLGEVRAFEFGSEACGWIFSVAVEPELSRSGVASELLAEACRRFRAGGITTIRTMVRRADVPVLSFFRSSGFVGGSFYQLELELGDGPSGEAVR
jgi:ribosomal protein S18 acetylase RimI-like enzyme